MPTIPEIKISIENKDLFVKDELIRQGTFLRSANGNLIMYTGGFTAVFPVKVQNEKWAFRCWHANMGSTAQRFKEIAKCVKSSQAPYLCDFAYVDKGILVDGKLYPTTRMKWVEGYTIKNYICKYAYNKEKLQKLADAFLGLIKDMHERGYAHGDLQHGNILVDNYGSLFLVDYDSFYCSALKGEKDIIQGLIDYQHPARSKNTVANEKLDYFSELIIYTSIYAIADNPSLLAKYEVAQSDKMLFSRKDFDNLSGSAIYKDLKSLNNSRVNQLLDILSLYLSKKSIKDLEPFDKLLNISSPPIQIKTKPTKPTIPIIQPLSSAPTKQYCIYCGTPFYHATSRFCYHCGKPRK